jgi:hypothetical protein
VRRGFVRSMRGHAQSESVVPWRGYVLWVGGTLLVLFFAADALMPPPAASRHFSDHKNADDPNPFRGERTGGSHNRHQQICAARASERAGRSV